MSNTNNTIVEIDYAISDYIINGDYATKELEQARKAQAHGQRFHEDSDVISGAILDDLIEVRYMFGYAVYVYHDSSISRPPVYLVNPTESFVSDSITQLQQLHQLETMEQSDQAEHIIQLTGATHLVYCEEAAFLVCLDQFLADSNNAHDNNDQERAIYTIVRQNATSTTDTTSVSFFEGYQGIGQSGGYHYGNSLWTAKWYYRKEYTLGESWQVLIGSEIREYSYKELYAKAKELYKAIYGVNDECVC